MNRNNLDNKFPRRRKLIRMKNKVMIARFKFNPLMKINSEILI